MRGVIEVLGIVMVKYISWKDLQEKWKQMFISDWFSTT